MIAALREHGREVRPCDCGEDGCEGWQMAHVREEQLLAGPAAAEDDGANKVTCIAGLVEGSRVWIGGDSAGVSGYSMMVRADQKVFRNGPMLFGFTSSFRMGQLLRYALTIPDHDPRVDVDKYMATTFVDAVRACLKNNGWAEKQNEQERGGTFLVAYQGRLFCVEGDYQVGSPANSFHAVGCGDDIARGAMFATPDLPGKDRVETALRAAECFSAGVRGPFVVECLESAPKTTEERP